MSLPHLSAADLDKLGLSAPAICDAVEATIRAQAAGKAAGAPKAMLTRVDGRYMMSAMATSDDPPLLVVKTMVQNPANPGAGRPYIDGLVTVLDAATGRPLALLDGPWITAGRTAALSAVAARRLAPPRARVLALLGAGVQAASHLAAMAALFPLEEVRIVGRGPDRAARLAETARAAGLSAGCTDSAKEAIEGADIIVSATSRDAPASAAIDARWLAPGSFAALPDLGHHWNRESLAAFMPLLVDDLAQEDALPAAHRLAPGAGVGGDLAGLVMGRVETAHPGTAAGFVFRGHAIGDLALAGLVVEAAGLLRA